METKTIDDKHTDDWFFDRKYSKIGIHTRKQWYVTKTENPNILKRFLAYLKNKESIYLEKGISCINGSLIKASRGCGPKDRDHRNKQADEIVGGSDDEYTRQQFALEDIFAFNYDDMLKCEPDKYKKWLYKIDNISFDRAKDIYKTEFRNKYLEFKYQYEEDKTNGNLEKIKDIACRLSTYILENDLNKGENFSDGGVICNIAIMISEYIRTGILDTNIKRFESYTIEHINEYYNTYVVFILLNIFTCHQQCFDMTINGIVDREKWCINLFRRRLTNKTMSSTCVIPRFCKDKYGNIILYCEKYDNDSEDGMDKEMV